MLASKLASKGLLTGLICDESLKVLFHPAFEVLKYTCLRVNLLGQEAEFGIDNEIGATR